MHVFEGDIKKFVHNLGIFPQKIIKFIDIALLANTNQNTNALFDVFSVFLFVIYFLLQPFDQNEVDVFVGMGLEKLFRDAVVDEGDALCAFDPHDHFFFEFLN